MPCSGTPNNGTPNLGKPFNCSSLSTVLPDSTLGGQGGLVSSFRREIPRVILWVIGVINLVVLTKSP